MIDAMITFRNILLSSPPVDFEGPAKMLVSLFQIRRQHIFDPFHKYADSA